MSGIHFEHKLKEETGGLENPNSMKNTLVFLTFDNENDITLLANCGISSGKLILDSGVDEGNMISDAKSNTNNFTSVELRGSANDDFIFGPSVMEVSNNNGTSYKKVNNFKELTTLNSTGKQGIVKITIKSSDTYPNPTLDSVCLLVNT